MLYEKIAILIIHFLTVMRLLMGLSTKQSGKFMFISEYTSFHPSLN